MNSPIALIVVALLTGVALPGLIFAGDAFRECWKTDHVPGYQSPLVHGWED